MTRPKGSRNKRQSRPPLTVMLSSEERIIYIANLIIDRILSDQAADGPILGEARKLQ